MSIYWKIYCTEQGDEGWKEIWSDSVPTSCPNNVSHTIMTDSSHEHCREKLISQLAPNTNKIKSTKFVRALVCMHMTSIEGKLRRIKLFSNNSKSKDYHIIEIYDATNHISLLESSPIYNTNDGSIIDIGVIHNSPLKDFVLEINVKSNTKSNQITIDRVLLYVV